MKTTKAERLLAEETALEISRGHMHSCTRQCADTRKVVHHVEEEEEEGDGDDGNDSFQKFHRRTEKDRGWIKIFSTCAFMCVSSEYFQERIQITSFARKFLSRLGRSWVDYGLESSRQSNPISVIECMV